MYSAGSAAARISPAPHKSKGRQHKAQHGQQAQNGKPQFKVQVGAVKFARASLEYCHTATTGSPPVMAAALAKSSGVPLPRAISPILAFAASIASFAMPLIDVEECDPRRVGATCISELIRRIQQQIKTCVKM